MKILALEFSSDHRSVAVADAHASPPGLAEIGDASSSTRSTKAFAMIESALRAAQLEREAIDVIAVGLGPGSYTGIRAAIAIAQGWQVARETRLLGISSADVLAAHAHAAGISGSVTIVIDAQRDEFYLAEFELAPAGVRTLRPLRLAAKAEIEARVHSGGVVLGPDVRPWLPRARELFPAAATLARLALGRADFVAGDRLEPIYLRPADFVKAPPPRIVL